MPNPNAHVPNFPIADPFLACLLCSGRWAPCDRVQPADRGQGGRYGGRDALHRPVVRVALHLRRPDQAAQRSGEQRKRQ